MSWFSENIKEFDCEVEKTHICSFPRHQEVVDIFYLHWLTGVSRAVHGLYYCGLFMIHTKVTRERSL